MPHKGDYLCMASGLSDIKGYQQTKTELALMTQEHYTPHISQCSVSCLQLQQKVMTTAILASMLVNVGTVLSVSAMTFAASASFAAAGFSGVGVLANWIKVVCLSRRTVYSLCLAAFRGHASIEKAVQAG